jgi:hypothetical protein
VPKSAILTHKLFSASRSAQEEIHSLKAGSQKPPETVSEVENLKILEVYSPP